MKLSTDSHGFLQAYADLAEQAQAVEEAQAAARHAADEAAGLREELGSRIDADLAAEEAAEKSEEAAEKAAAEAEALAAANAAAIAENERLKRQLKELSASVRSCPSNLQGILYTLLLKRLKCQHKEPFAVLHILQLWSILKASSCFKE